nr:hypothetical protein CFP56_65856 [Quercus suber]
MCRERLHSALAIEHEISDPGLLCGYPVTLTWVSVACDECDCCRHRLLQSGNSRDVELWRRKWRDGQRRGPRGDAGTRLLFGNNAGTRTSTNTTGKQPARQMKDDNSSSLSTSSIVKISNLIRFLFQFSMEH